MTQFKPLIWVEGIIGCGKTTLSRKVGEILGLRVIEEPVAENPYLEPFYRDPQRYAFGLQVFMLHRRYAMQQLASYECTPVSPYSGAILDRSISGDRVFAKLHFQAGNITDLDWATYQEAYSIMARSLLPPTLLVYLDAQPETAHKRMSSRGREAESGVPLSYLKDLRDGYVELIEDAERGLLPWAHAVRVARIPWDPDLVDDSTWAMVARTIKDSCRGF